jgi:hypothetical protein
MIVCRKSDRFFNALILALLGSHCLELETCAQSASVQIGSPAPMASVRASLSTLKTSERATKTSVPAARPSAKFASNIPLAIRNQFPSGASIRNPRSTRSWWFAQEAAQYQRQLANPRSPLAMSLRQMRQQNEIFYAKMRAKLASQQMPQQTVSATPANTVRESPYVKYYNFKTPPSAQRR